MSNISTVRARFNDYILSLEEKEDVLRNMVHLASTFGFDDIIELLNKTLITIEDDMSFYNSIYDEILELETNYSNIMEQDNPSRYSAYLQNINNRISDINNIGFN